MSLEMSKFGKADGVETAGRQNDNNRYGENIITFPGLESQACCTMITRQPGRPCLNVIRLQINFLEVMNLNIRAQTSLRLRDEGELSPNGVF